MGSVLCLTAPTPLSQVAFPQTLKVLLLPQLLHDSFSK